MMKPWSVLIIAGTLMLGCGREGSVRRSKGEILERYAADGVVVVNHGGPAVGPYREAGGFVGHPDQAFNLSWKENGREVRVAAPSEAGFYYQIDRFGTESGDSFWVFKNKREPL